MEVGLGRKDLGPAVPLGDDPARDVGGWRGGYVTETADRLHLPAKTTLPVELSGDCETGQSVSGMPRRTASMDSESVPLLSSDDNSRTSLLGRPGYTEPYDSPEVQSFLKGTPLPLVTESKQSPPIIAAETLKQSSIVTIFVLWNTMVGTSLLAMPWGVERAGLAMGVVLPIVMGALCCYTAYCNVATQAAYGPAGGEISELTRHMLGPRFEFLSKLFSYIVLLGALIVYWILMSNFLYFTVDYIYTATTGGFKDIETFKLTGSEICLVDQVKSNITSDLQPSVFRRIWNLGTVPIYLIFLLAPLLSFKSATFFTKFNSLGTMSLVYLMVFVVVKAWSWGFNLDLSNPSSVHYSELVQPSFFATSGTLAMSYYMHNIIITVMRSNKNQRNNARDVTVGYSLGIGTYLIVGSLFYISFPLAKTCIEDNMLNNFASWDVLTLVARMFLFFQLTTVYPLINYMLRYQVMTAFFSSPYPSLLHVLVFNSIVVVACVLFAVFLPRIGTVIRFTGAISGCFHVFTLPCLLKLAGQKQSGELSIGSLIFHLAIPAAGAVNLVAQFFVSDS